MLRAMNTLHNPGAAMRTDRGWAPLILGFRPFFLLAGIAATCLIAVWPLVWRGALLPYYYDPLAWHVHEMLFGYVVAVVAGFLLTAVRNWTGVSTWTGSRLAGLALLWLLARVLPWLGNVPVLAVILVDVAFLPILAASLAGPLWQDRNRINRVFVPLLGAMALANLLSHLQLAGVVAGLGDMWRVMLGLVLLLLALVAGRVLPFFTQSVITGFQARSRRWVESATFVLAVLVVIGEGVADLPEVLHACLWFAFGGVQLVRLLGWFNARIVRMPVLWILHVGYAWLGVGSLLYGASLLGLLPLSVALHMLTIGAVGVFTLSMMARVTRGHTGRNIKVDVLTTIAFGLINVAAVIRVFFVWLVPTHYTVWIDLAAALWVIAFALFLAVHSRMLLRAG